MNVFFFIFERDEGKHHLSDSRIILFHSMYCYCQLWYQKSGYFYAEGLYYHPGRDSMTDIGGKHIHTHSGGPEPEGAGPSPLNSVSDSHMCPTDFFYLRSQYFCLCPCLRAFLYLLLFISAHFSLSLSSIFFLFTFFPFPTPFFFSFLSSVRHYLVSDARAFPGRPGRPARYALAYTYIYV